MPDAPPAGAPTRAARWLALAILVAAGAARGADVPNLSGRVVDDAAILGFATRDRLTAALEAHERSTGNQIAVLTARTIGGEPIEDYANRVFAAWKLGQRGKDNGVLLVVVTHDRKMRIEVGYGLEATLPDATAGRIIHDVMTPSFKAGDYQRGISDGVTAIVGTLEGRPDAIPPPATGDRFRAVDMSWPTRIGLSAIIFSIIGLFTFAGIMAPGAGGWFLYVFLMPFWALFPMPFFGVRAGFVILGLYLIGFPILRAWLPRTAWYRTMKSRLDAKRSSSSGGFTGGGSSSSSDSSSSAGGGGFSGGGGSSGGGGASGSW